MYHLDSAGRYAPSSLDVSRAAARRHELSAAVRDRRAASAGRPTVLRRLRSLVPGALRRSVTAATESPVPAPAQRTRALAEAPRPGALRHDGRDERRRAEADVAA